MKKLILAGAVFGIFSSGLFAQKIWFTSLECSPSAIGQTRFYVNTNYEAEELGRKYGVGLGLGFRVFRQSHRFLEPEIGMEFRTFRPVEVDFAFGPNVEYTTRQFGLLCDFGYRLEWPENLHGWRFLIGPQVACWLPFYSARIFQTQKVNEAFYDEPKVGWGLAMNFGRVSESGRRVDWGGQLLRFGGGNTNFYNSQIRFGLLKLRAAISIDRFEK